MTAKRMSLEFRLRKIDETRNYDLDEMKQWFHEWRYKNTCKYLNFVEHLLKLASTVTGCISISAFASFAYVPFGITSSAIGIKIW